MAPREIATLAGGCFWCTEAIFKSLKGVLKVTPGYSGGDIANPTYGQVLSGQSGHAEVVQIEFDPEVISYKDLLSVFFKLHDPTQLNRQGADIGTQYRSAIFVHGKEQERIAQEAKAKIPEVVTQITAYENFYPAEEYHRDYYFKNRSQPYCMLVIDPKIDKLKREFKEYLK